MPDNERGGEESGKAPPPRPAAVPFALDVAPGALLLLLREPLGWREIARAPLRSDGEVMNAALLVRAARFLVRDGPLPVEIWLPAEQVMVRREVLPKDAGARAQAAFRLVAEATGQPSEDLALAISPPLPDGRSTILATFAQSCREARAFAEGWGFAPQRVSTSVSAADFGPSGAWFLTPEAFRAAAPSPTPATGGAGETARDISIAAAASLASSVDPDGQSTAIQPEPAGDAPAEPRSGPTATGDFPCGAAGTETQSSPPTSAPSKKGRLASAWLRFATLAALAGAVAAGYAALRDRPELSANGKEPAIAATSAQSAARDTAPEPSSLDTTRSVALHVAALARPALPEPSRPDLPKPDWSLPAIGSEGAPAPASLAGAPTGLSRREPPSADLTGPEASLADLSAVIAALRPVPDERPERRGERERLVAPPAEDPDLSARVVKAGWHAARGAATELQPGAVDARALGNPSTFPAGLEAPSPPEAEDFGGNLRLAQTAAGGDEPGSGLAPVTTARLPAARPKPEATQSGDASRANADGAAAEPIPLPTSRNYGYAPGAGVESENAVSSVGAADPDMADGGSGDTTVSTLAVRSAPAPKGRPAGLAAPIRPSERSERARRTPLPELARAAPQTVQRASIAQGVPLDRAALIGILNLDTGRQALLRLSNGRYERVLVGDELDGWEVSMIGTDAIRLERGSEERTLLLVNR